MISLVSPNITQERELTLFQTTAGRKILLLSFLSSFALSSARRLFALAISRYLSELAIRSGQVYGQHKSHITVHVSLTRLVSELGYGASS